MICHVCHCIIEPTDQIATCKICKGVIHSQCRSGDETCDICDRETKEQPAANE
jgi:hypothetical protein